MSDSESEISAESPPPAEEPLMSDPAVTAFLTQQLCHHGGRLPLAEIPKYVELSPEHIASIIREEAKRFPQPEPGTVLVQSPVRLCGGYLKNTCQGKDCGRLHLCRHFILGKCFIRGNRHGTFCKFSHDLRCEVNSIVLKAHEIANLREKELRVLLQLNDPSCMPEVCYDYKGVKNAATCHKGDQCPRLHVCQYFVKGECLYFSRCSRSHNLLDPDIMKMMEGRGFNKEMVQNIQLLRTHQCKELEKEQPSKDRRKEFPHAKGGTTESKRAALLRTRFGVRSDMRGATDRSPFASRTSTQYMETERPYEPPSEENTYGRKPRSPLPPTNKTVTTYPRAEPCSNIQPKDKPNENDSVQLPTSTTKTVTTYPKEASITAIQKMDKLNVESSVSQYSTCSETALMDRVAAQKTPTVGELPESFSSLSLRTTTSSTLESVQSTQIQQENRFSKPPSSPLITELETAGRLTTANLKTKSLNQLNAQTSDNGLFHLNMADGTDQQTSQPAVRDSVNAASSPTNVNNLRSPVHLSTLDVSKPVQASSLPSQTVIPGPVINTVSKDSVNASTPPSLTLPSTVSSYNKTTTDYIRCTDLHNVHYSVRLSPSKPATVTNANPGIGPGAKQLIENAAAAPSNVGIYEFNPFEEFSLPESTQSVMRVYVQKEPAVPEDRGDPNEICFFHVWKFCEKKDRCGQMHYRLPYRWQILKTSGDWDDLPWMEDIEKAYSDPDSTRSDKHDINFEKMVSSYHQVRRLSTPSSVTQPPDHRMTTEWVWYWKNELGNWIEYGKHGGKEKSNVASADLENIYLADKESTVSFQAGSQRYEIKFKDMIQKNVHYRTQKEIRRRPRFVSKDDVDILKGRARTGLSPQPSSQNEGVPAYWDKTALPDSGYKLVEISNTSKEFKDIEQSFGSTMPKYSIKKLQRIQNVTLWRFYQLQMEVIKKQNRKDVLEKKLFHGTDITHVPAICKDNFDWRICGLNGTVYGRGSYFARDASYSHNYCSAAASSKTMFLARVLVGDYVSGHSSYARPPLKPASQTNYYDSCVDKPHDPSIYVVFEKHQIYPEYVIEYGVNSSCRLS